METQMALRDAEVPPTPQVLEAALGSAYPTFSELMDNIASTALALTPEWRYYKDGNAWLCKVCSKKKTIFWLSVWEQTFKAAFYFTEKTGSGIAALEIDPAIKADFTSAKPIGKLIPLVFTMRTKDQLRDLLKVVEYKKRLN